MLSALVQSFIGRVVNNPKVPRQTIEPEGQPYMTRYFLGGQDSAGSLPRLFRANERFVGEGRSLYLHHFHSSDHDRGVHNHPYSGDSLILAGGYREERCSVVHYEPELVPAAQGSSYMGVVLVPTVFTGTTFKTYKPGSWNRIGVHDFHRTQLLDEEAGCWTLFLTGPRVQHWGFLDEDYKFHPHQPGKNPPRVQIDLQEAA